MICRSHPLLRLRYAGVYPRDLLPAHPSRDSFYICNTAPSSHPGIHWVLINRNSSQHTEFFDSLGRHAIHSSIKKFLGDYYTRAIVQTQETMSSLCGEYCLFYITLRCQGHPMEDVMALLNAAGSQSDWLVSSYVYETFDFRQS